MATFFWTAPQYDTELSDIENHIEKVCIENNESQATLEGRLTALHAAIQTLTDSLRQTHTTYQLTDKGEHSKPIHTGRYRIYFVIRERANHDLDITYNNIEANRSANVHRFPAHKIRTFDTEE